MTNEQIAKALLRHVEAYKRRHPMRKADFHSAECLCERCFVDFAKAASDRLVLKEVSRG